MTGWGNGPTMFNPGGFDPVLFATKWLISGAQNVTKVGGAHTHEGGRLLRVGQQQPARQRRLERPSRPLALAPPDSTGNYFSDVLIGHARRVRRAVAEHRPRHGLQHLRGLRAGQLEGEQPADCRSAACAYHTSAAGTSATASAWRCSIPRCTTRAHQARLPAASRGRPATAACRRRASRCSRVLRAARRLRLRPVRRRPHAAARRLRHVQLPRCAGPVFGVHRSAVRGDVHQRVRQSRCSQVSNVDPNANPSIGGTILRRR